MLEGIMEKVAGRRFGVWERWVSAIVALSLLATGLLKLWRWGGFPMSPDGVFPWLTEREVHVLGALIEIGLAGIIGLAGPDRMTRYIALSGWVMVLWAYRANGVEVSQCSCLGGVAGRPGAVLEGKIALGLLLFYSAVSLVWALVTIRELIHAGKQGDRVPAAG